MMRGSAGGKRLDCVWFFLAPDRANDAVTARGDDGTLISGKLAPLAAFMPGPESTAPGNTEALVRIFLGAFYGGEARRGKLPDLLLGT